MLAPWQLCCAFGMHYAPVRWAIRTRRGLSWNIGSTI